MRKKREVLNNDRTFNEGYRWWFKAIVAQEVGDSERNCNLGGVN